MASTVRYIQNNRALKRNFDANADARAFAKEASAMADDMHAVIEYDDGDMEVYTEGYYSYSAF